MYVHACVSNLSEMILKSKPLFVLGDLNDCQLSQNTKLGKIIKQLKLEQITNKPTRITPT